RENAHALVPHERFLIPAGKRGCSVRPVKYAEHRFLDLGHEVVTEAVLLGLVPLRGLQQLRGCLGVDTARQRHLRFAASSARICACTSSASSNSTLPFSMSSMRRRNSSRQAASTSPCSPCFSSASRDCRPR